MTFAEWQVAFNYGVPFAIIIAIGLFTWKLGWPYLTRKVDEMTTAMIAQGREYGDSVKLMTTTFNDTINAQRSAHLDMQNKTFQMFSDTNERQRHDFLTELDRNRNQQSQAMTDTINSLTGTLKDVVTTVNEVRDMLRAQAVREDAWDGMDRRIRNGKREAK